MTRHEPPAFLARLKQPQFWTASQQGVFIYAYLRSRSSANGKAGSPYYIGLASSGTRPYGKHSCVVPKDRSRIRILRILQTWDEAAKWEKFYIKKFGRIDLGTGILRNLTDGGDGVANPSAETRKKISDAAKAPERVALLRAMAAEQKGKKVILTPEQKLAMGRPGHTKSETWKQKMSTRQKGRQKGETELKNLTLSIRKRSWKLRAAWAHSVGLSFMQVRDFSPTAFKNLKKKAEKGWRGEALLTNIKKLSFSDRELLKNA